MKTTEDNFDEPEEAEDQSKLALTLIGVMCIIGLAIGIYFKPGARQTMTIEMPETPAIQKDVSLIADSVYVIYTLKNDSIALHTKDTLLFTTLAAIFADTSFLKEMRNEIVLIKQTNHSDHTTLIHTLENSNLHGLRRFVVSSYQEGELDTLSKRYLR
jgi:hypothetical protein